MDLVKRELIDYLFDRYMELENKKTGYSERMDIDKYLGYLGVYVFEIEGNKVNVEMEDGTTFEILY